MQRLSFPTRGTQTHTGRIGRIALATGITGAAVFGTFAAANAQTTTTPTAAKTQLTQAQLDAAKACLMAKGFTLKPHGHEHGDENTVTTIAGSPTTTKVPHTAPTAEQRAAFEVAAVACGLPAGGRGGRGGPDGHGGPGGHGHRGGLPLTDAQKACLTGRGITLPTPPAEGSNTASARPARIAPTDAERAAREAAETACGIVRPAGGTSGTATTPATVKA